MAFDVGRAGLHAGHMCLAQTQLSRVFDGDDALVFRNVGRENVEQGGFSGAGAASDHNVQPRLDAALEQLQHALGERQLLDQVLALQGVASETANGKQRAVHGYGWNSRVDARSVGQAGVHQRRRLVHAPAYARNNLFNDAQQVGVVFELDRRSVKLAGALHVHQTRRGHQDVRDGGIAQQRLEGTQAEYFIQHLLDDPVLFHQAERRFLFLNEPCDGRADFGACPLAGHGGQRFKIDAVQQLAMERKLQLLMLRRVAFIAEQAIDPARFATSRLLYRFSQHVLIS